VLLIVVGLVASSCSGGSNENPSVEAIRTRGKLVVGIKFEPDWACATRRRIGSRAST